MSIRYACDETFLLEREDSVPTKEQIKEWINDAERGDMELTEEDKSEIEKMSYQDLVKQYIDSCGSIYDFIRASEDYERRISLTDLLETRLYACKDELNPEETAYNADDELTWVSPWGINFEGKHFSPQDFTPEQFVAFGAYHPCLSQYALYLHSGESFEPER